MPAPAGEVDSRRERNLQSEVIRRLDERALDSHYEQARIAKNVEGESERPTLPADIPEESSSSSSE